MSEAKLGLPIDIHGGGQDLIFPHHTNEIAQSCAAHGHDDPAAYAKYWMHNGFLDFSGEKMSKSLGNVVLVHDLRKDYPGEVIRLALLSAHYRAPLNWTQELLEQTHARLNRIYQILRNANSKLAGSDYNSELWKGHVQHRTKPVLKALCDDLNTPAAIATLDEFSAIESRDYLLDMTSDLEGILNFDHEFDTGNLVGIARDTLVQAGAFLGILQQNPEDWFKQGASDDLTAQVEALLVERAAARAAKNWPESDRIRDALNALNVEVMDGPNGATWKVKGK
jgi:cysteinyl-tRNA synthetase